MLFQTTEFAVFLVFVLGSYFLLPQRGRHWLLLVSSYAFYMAWDYRFSVLMASSTLIDYLACLGMEKYRGKAARRLLLIASIVTNLGLLGFFKYAGFFATAVNDVAAALDGGPVLPMISVILPVGISFYTFQSMSQSIDVYRREIPAERNLLRFAVYVSFFPQLVAGPIIRGADFLPQLDAKKRFFVPRIMAGLDRFLIGLAKKLVIADNAGVVADLVFSDPTQADTKLLWLGALCFTIQIYADFSAYSDMAIGVARMFGFKFRENFLYPYTAASPSEFWRRWHISLSSWLRDYLYISLGGNRKGPVRTYFNLAATMLLGGLWHGASYNFILWGAIHGAALILQRLFGRWFAPFTTRLPRVSMVVSWLVWQIVVVAAWVPFRAESMGDTGLILKGMFVDWTDAIPIWRIQGVNLWLLGFIFVLFASDQALGRFAPEFKKRVARNALTRGLWIGSLLFVTATYAYDGQVPFVYFQF